MYELKQLIKKWERHQKENANYPPFNKFLSDFLTDLYDLDRKADHHEAAIFET